MIEPVKTALVALLFLVAAVRGAPPATAGDSAVRLASISSAEQLHAASQLRNADAPAPRGPAEACLEQVKIVMCPIIGQMPFFRDMAGQIAVIGGIFLSHEYCAPARTRILN